MAALGTVALKLGLSDKEFKSQLNKSVDSVKKSVDQMKNIMIAAKLGSVLFSSAQNKMQENLKLLQIEASALAEGLSQSMIDSLKPLIDQFDYIGIGADTASEAIFRFILQGKAMSLQQIGIYVDKNTQSLLQGMSAADRFAWAMENIPNRLQDVMDKLDPTTKSMLEFNKKAKDVKETLGMTFLGVIMNIINSFGGLTNAMKIALIAFTAYKTAMIIGNTAIGMSKALAQGGVFVFPVVAALGAAALASLLALGAGTGIAINALNNIPEPNAPTVSSSTQKTPEVGANIVVIEKDRFGQTQKMISERSGSNLNSIQTSFGGNN